MGDVVTKVLVSRLRPYLSDLIGPLQSSFILGQGTADNIILAQEVMHYIHKSKQKKGVLAFNVDLEKAYDRVNWDFLEHTLADFGIPASIVKMVMWCVRNDSMSLLWNGSRLNTFTPTRGLRQGDPMSPYLFVLCMEKLSLLIQQKVDLGLWQPIKLSRCGPPISHLLFADDVLLFCKATNTQVNLLSSMLDDFCQASGMKNTVEKSKFICSKFVSSVRKRSFMSICLLVQGRVRCAIFNPLIEKIQRRMSSWKSNLLNKACRLCLAKSVTTAVPIYIMQSMWLPQNVCHEMDKMTRNFIWGGDPNNRSLNLKGIVKATNMLRSGFRLHLGDGDLSLWYDNWSGLGLLCSMVVYVHISDTQLTVKDLWKDSTWDFNLLYTLIHVHVKEAIVQLIIPSSYGPNNAWSLDDSEIEAQNAFIRSTVEAQNALLIQAIGGLKAMRFWVPYSQIGLGFGGCMYLQSLRDHSIRGGGVIRSDCGIWISGFSTTFGIGSSILAELLTIEFGLKLVWNLGYRNVILESDCLEAIHFISGRVQVHLDRLAGIILSISDLLERNWEVRTYHIFRKGNSVADFLAKLSLGSLETSRI
ncbi:PREDICTED: uncharacterized protein LOC109327034 [Lupinus angustifolius]|uniref:uncharacterized protein LOC109327034 n=1 Tax=Lupinus angustifolius TaxID=3871 RepID=UPI00092F78D4|nr:PREDICTED: uncharacterized protein LOC109327034 [Lupinus angustifolius]